VAPERLLAVSPAQPPLVDGASNGSDAAVEEALESLRRRRRGRGGDLGRSPRRRSRGGDLTLGRLGGPGGLLEGPAAGGEGEGEEDEHDGERPAGDHGSLHGRLS